MDLSLTPRNYFQNQTLQPRPICFQKHHPVGQSFEYFWCVKWFPDMPVLGSAFEIYMLAIMLILPCLVMIVTYTWIANIIWHVATRRADMRSGRYDIWPWNLLRVCTCNRYINPQLIASYLKHLNSCHSKFIENHVCAYLHLVQTWSYLTTVKYLYVWSGI